MVKILVVMLIVFIISAIFLVSDGHPELPFPAPFRESDLVKLRGETSVELKFAPQGYNSNRPEETIATFQPEEKGIIKQGGDIPKACWYEGIRWWCRIWLTENCYGWTEARTLERING